MDRFLFSTLLWMLIAAIVGFLLGKLGKMSRQLEQESWRKVNDFIKSVSDNTGHTCSGCGKDIAHPHRFITGKEGYEFIPHFKLTITSSSSRGTWIFCNMKCLIAWFKESFAPQFEYVDREDANG
jgi:hypothetical protein